MAACGAPPPAAPSPEADARAAAATITAADIGVKIDALAHDTAGGRDTPSPELEKAARYIADQLRAAGLEPLGDEGTYIDRWDWVRTTLDPEETRVAVPGGDADPTYATDFYLLEGPAAVEAPAYYMGVIGQTDAPPEEARGRVLIFRHPGTSPDTEWQMRMGAALQPAMMTGAPAVIFITDPDFDESAYAPVASELAGRRAPLAVAGLTHEAGAALIADLGANLAELEAAGAPTALGDQAVVIEAERVQKTDSPPNVAAILRGSDPELADSYVVMTAHFDHLGTGEPDEAGDTIFNGADDNASGTAAVIEAAEAFAALDGKPARSIIFLLVSGEEYGLLGSRAWVENPPVDIGAVVANINLDMVGRTAPDTVIGIGQEYTTLAGDIDAILAAHPDLGLNVILDPVPEENYFFRSDQLPFIQRGIPAVFFTTGDHEDYHARSDEPAAIDDDKAARIARLAFHLAHAIATSAEPPEWTEEGQRIVEERLTGSPF